MITAIPNTMRKYVGKVRGKYGAAMEDYNGVQDSLLSGANTMKVTGFGQKPEASCKIKMMLLYPRRKSSTNHN